MFSLTMEASGKRKGVSVVVFLEHQAEMQLIFSEQCG